MESWHLRRDRSQDWRSPASREAVYATGTTPLGRVALTRKPGSRTSAEAAADGHENWVLSLRDSERLTVHGLAAPGYGSRKVVRAGVEGILDGSALRIAAMSALLQSGRSVRMTGASLDITFVPRRLTVRLLEAGVERGVRPPGGWRFSHPTDAAILAACLFEWAELDHFLRTPGLRAL
ncbi:hypothetical protein ACIGO8_26055 [Streptomyces sp. NPDC053493]|uniref:hypothetical protein n=1 Tax=Streptomyces sp. NPDC053493 TaxID=3365705 RepID=UPI0037D6D456